MPWEPVFRVEISRYGKRRRYCPLRAKDPERRAKFERAQAREAAARMSAQITLSNADYHRKRSEQAVRRRALRAVEEARGRVAYRGRLPKLNAPGVREQARKRLLRGR